jgi:diadenosine tetraphosphate (Ap4A) HIT family hydrolase
MVRDAISRRCPFCILDPEYNKVIAESRDWHAWQSSSPEKHTLHHFIIAPKRHITDTAQLTEKEQLTLFMIMKVIRDKYSINSCGILIRDGDARLSAGTIEHLHVHLMVPDGTGRVESPFYKGTAADAKSLAQAIVFEKMRTGTKFADLDADEKALVKDILR